MSAAFDLARTRKRRKVTSVTKSNAQQYARVLWDEVFNQNNEQAPVPPPSYHRREVQAQAQRARALHINTLTLIETLHLLALCRLAVQVAHRRCPPLLPKGAGGRPRTYREESLVLIALLKTRLSTLLPGYTRVARELARPGLWLAAGRRGPAVRAEPFSIVQTRACGRSVSL